MRRNKSGQAEAGGLHGSKDKPELQVKGNKSRQAEAGGLHGSKDSLGYTVRNNESKVHRGMLLLLKSIR